MTSSYFIVRDAEVNYYVTKFVKLYLPLVTKIFYQLILYIHANIQFSANVVLNNFSIFYYPCLNEFFIRPLKHSISFEYIFNLSNISLLTHTHIQHIFGVHI